MKKLSILLGAFLTLALININHANACTVTPVDPVQQKNDLVANVLTKMNVSIEDVSSVKVADYAGDYVWTPMCPKGLNSEAKFTISFRNINDPLTMGCTAEVKVTKNWIYEDGQPKYSYNFIQPATCLE